MALPVVWSDHAIKRAVVRFGWEGDTRDVNTPSGLIALWSSRAKVGSKFRVKKDNAIFVCVRNQDCIVIKTVMRKPKYNRQE